MNSLASYHDRLQAEALAEQERQRTRQAVVQLVREHPVGTTVAVGVAAFIVGALLASRR